jgi:uncharacterized low-complexity protein
MGVIHVLFVLAIAAALIWYLNGQTLSLDGNPITNISNTNVFRAPAPQGSCGSGKCSTPKSVQDPAQDPIPAQTQPITLKKRTAPRRSW